MLSLKTIREHPEFVDQGAANKGEKIDIKGILALDGKVRKIIKDVEDLKAMRNRSSEEISRLKQVGKDAREQISEMQDVSNASRSWMENLLKIERNFMKS